MPKVKPTWVCQHCERQFTTKYSLMRHFRRFPQHSPPHLSPGGSDIKPVTVTVNENVRTVTAIPLPSSSSHEHGTRHKQYRRNQEEDDDDDDDDEDLEDNSSTTETKTRTTNPGSAFSLRNVSDTEESPSCTDFEFEESPDSIDDFTGKKNFPFLPSFLEEEQILDIATPQHSTCSPVPPACSASDPSRLLSSPLSAHYSWSFARDAAMTEPGQALLSPLTPACATTNFRQIFQEEEEKLKRLTASSKLRSPVESAALDQSLFLGDEEATSPFTFLEKTTSHEPILPVSTSLDFLSPPYHKESAYSSSSAHEISIDDLDLGRFYAPMV
jgi:hypothetical protein